MTNIIVVFPKQEDGRNIRNILVKHGFSVTGVCTSGSQVLQYADELSGGIVVSGYRYPDMIYSDLCAELSSEFQMLLVASQRYLSEVDTQDIVCVSIPLKTHELISTVNMMAESMERRLRKRSRKNPQRREQDMLLIRKAKGLLMERNHMTEEEAHRYIQKCSMDSGTNMAETAQMVLSLMG